MGKFDKVSRGGRGGGRGRGGSRGGGRGGRGGGMGRGGGGGSRGRGRGGGFSRGRGGRGGARKPANKKFLTKSKSQPVDPNDAIVNAKKRRAEPEDPRTMQKRKKLERQKQKPNFELMVEAKQVWETARVKENEAEHRQALERLFNLISGQIPALIFKHDASRIIETVLKHGNDKQRRAVCDELKGKLVELAMSRYGRFIAQKMLKYGTRPQRAAMLKELYGHVARLIKHRDASRLVEFAYVMIADARQRATLAEEFFGPEFALVKHPEDRTLAQVLARADAAARLRILTYISERLQAVLSKAKVDVTHSILHLVLREFFINADLKSARDLIALIDERVVEMVHTKDGAFVAWIAISLGTAKNRKQIVRSIKPFVERVMADEYGHAVLARALGCIDDTVLLRKVLLPDIVRCVPDMLRNRYGRRILTLLVDESVDAHEVWPGDDDVHLVGTIFRDDARALLANAIHVPLVKLPPAPPSKATSKPVNEAKVAAAEALADRQVVASFKKPSEVRRNELLPHVANAIHAAMLQQLPSLVCDHLANPLLDAVLQSKPAGDDAHAELCDALLSLVTAEKISDYVPTGALDQQQQPQEEEQDEVADDDEDEESSEKENNDNDDADDDDDNSDNNESDEESDDDDRSESSSNDDNDNNNSTNNAESADFEEPTQLLESPVAGRWLKRLVRNKVAFGSDDESFGDVLLERLTSTNQFASFAQRPGSAYLVLTLLSSVATNKAKAAAKQLRGVSLDTSGPGTDALAKWLKENK